MKIPAGFVVAGKTLDEQERKKFALKLEKNLYGQKQAGRVWYLKLGFRDGPQSEGDRQVSKENKERLQNKRLRQPF